MLVNKESSSCDCDLFCSNSLPIVDLDLELLSLSFYSFLLELYFRKLKAKINLDVRAISNALSNPGGAPRLASRP